MTRRDPDLAREDALDRIEARDPDAPGPAIGRRIGRRWTIATTRPVRVGVGSTLAGAFAHAGVNVNPSTGESP